MHLELVQPQPYFTLPDARPGQFEIGEHVEMPMAHAMDMAQLASGGHGLFGFAPRCEDKKRSRRPTSAVPPDNPA